MRHIKPWYARAYEAVVDFVFGLWRVITVVFIAGILSVCAVAIKLFPYLVIGALIVWALLR